MKRIFKITWRHEMLIEADTPEEAKQIWLDTDLGHLNRARQDGCILDHEFVERVSFEDEDYNEIQNL